MEAISPFIHTITKEKSGRAKSSMLVSSGLAHPQLLQCVGGSSPTFVIWLVEGSIFLPSLPQVQLSQDAQVMGETISVQPSDITCP